MKRKLFMFFLIGLLALGVSSDAYAKKKQKLTKEEKEAAKLEKRIEKTTNILGTNSSWKPTVLKDLHKGMTCGEVKQYFRGITCGDIIPKATGGLKSSIAEYKFHFVTGRLYSVTISFGPRLLDEKRFSTALFTVAQLKWGKLPENMKQAKWGNPDFDDVEIKYVETHWEIKVDLPSYDPGETNAANLDEAGIKSELQALLGPGGIYLPTVISKLSGGMTCEQVNGIFPLYECKTGVSHHFTRASVTGHPLVAGLHFSFQNNRLTYVTLIFHYQIARDMFKKTAFAVLKAKWGTQVRLFPDKEYATVYPKSKGVHTLKFNGNRWELQIGMEGKKAGQ